MMNMNYAATMHDKKEIADLEARIAELEAENARITDAYKLLIDKMNEEDECERCKHLENKCYEWREKFTKKADELVALQVKTTWANTAKDECQHPTWYGKGSISICADCGKTMEEPDDTNISP